MTLPVPKAYQKLGRYRIEHEIASGGMAVVCLAKLIGAAGFSKQFAIKKILPQFSNNPEFVNMLVTEAKILTRLKHRNIVEVFELGVVDKTHFIVMEYVDGMNLRELIRNIENKRTRLPQHLAQRIIADICSGLEYAHLHKNDAGKPEPIIHRDISPQNILVSQSGEIKITDFGIAKITGQNQNTQTGVLKGKFAYMSPEQARGLSLTPRSDIFAVGLLFYELLTGKKFFSGSNDMEILNKVREPKIVLPDGIPPDLRAILNLALAPESSLRYQHIGRMGSDLESCAQKLTAKNNMTLCEFMAGLNADADQAQNAPFSKTVMEQPLTVIHDKTRMETNPNAKSFFGKGEHDASDKTPRASVKKNILAGVITGVIPVFFLLSTANPFSKTVFPPPVKIISSGEIVPEFVTQLGQLHFPVEPELKNTTNLPSSPVAVFTRSTALPVTKFGSLSVIARPWAITKLDQNPKRETPVTFHEIKTGTHELSLYFPPQKKWLKKSVEIQANDTTRCLASFGARPRLNCSRVN